jgi:hypothetical protein
MTRIFFLRRHCEEAQADVAISVLFRLDSRFRENDRQITLDDSQAT